MVYGVTTCEEGEVLIWSVLQVEVFKLIYDLQINSCWVLISKLQHDSIYTCPNSVWL